MVLLAILELVNAPHLLQHVSIVQEDTKSYWNPTAITNALIPATVHSLQLQHLISIVSALTIHFHDPQISQMFVEWALHFSSGWMFESGGSAYDYSTAIQDARNLERFNPTVIHTFKLPPCFLHSTSTDQKKNHAATSTCWLYQ
ncbi:hypothetical protein Pst134EB_029529 [Puccinia striiformis f. sp. tritici]|nr:hypothetical protein Pst134EB_029529 [Puccinia striiformis f. sp. tritici]